MWKIPSCFQFFYITEVFVSRLSDSVFGKLFPGCLNSCQKIADSQQQNARDKIYHEQEKDYYGCPHKLSMATLFKSIQYWWAILCNSTFV